MNNHPLLQWFLRFLKGMLIGTGFILPGVSGGALAAIFGLYERMVSFMAHLTRQFWQNLRFFLPVALGMLAGIVVLSHPLSFFLKNYPAPTMWCFIGCMGGTFPALWKQAGQKGRRPFHMLVLAVSAVAGLLLFALGARLTGGSVPGNVFTWMAAGAIIALGILIPGLSPSNFLLYMGMYAGLVQAFKALDLTVLLPLGLGGLGCLLLLAKAADRLFQVAYAGMFHFILGVVLASTIAIIPVNFNYFSAQGAGCILTALAGIVLGGWMSSLEEQYKPG